MEEQIPTGGVPPSKPITVSVAVQAGGVQDLQLPAGTTLEEALRAADLANVIEDIGAQRNVQVRVNGKPASLKERLHDGAAVIVVGQVSGGRAGFLT